MSVCVASRLVQAEATRRLESSNPVGFEIQSPGVVGLLLDRRDVPDSVEVVVSVVAVKVDLLSVPRAKLVAVVSHARSERVARLSDVLFVASRDGAGDDVDHVFRFAAQAISPSSAYRVGSACARAAL